MKRKEIIAKNEISELCSFTLGGYEQKVLIEGKKKDAPIVIALHGGPGTPIPFSVGCRGLFPAFTDEFIMVYWDQLGCGINDHVIDDTFSIDSFVRMTEELTAQIKKKFPDQKRMIFSTSWGSILSAKLLERDPHAVDAVVVCGQIVKDVLICDEVRGALSQSKISKKYLERINQVTVDHYTDEDLQLIAGSLRKYTDAYQNRAGVKAPMGPIIRGLLTSPDYSLKDFKAVMINGYRKNTSLWKEILKIDLSGVLSNVKIPYIILQGETDLVASTKTVKELTANSENANISCQVIPKTGHFPGVEMMDSILAVLKKIGRSL